MQHTEKGMLGGIHHNPSMPAPDSQVTRLRSGDLPKLIGPLIKVRRARVLKRETRALIESVDKMRAIGREIRRMMARIQRGTQNRQTLIRTQEAGHGGRLLKVRSFVGEVISPVGAYSLVSRLLLLLRQPRADSSQGEKEDKQAAFGVEPHSPFHNEPS